MNWLFWCSAVFVAFTYVGYPLWTWTRARLRPRPVHTAPIVPDVSIVMAVHNEAGVLPSKLRSLDELDYPKDRYESIVVSDASTDSTDTILANWAEERHRVIVSQHHDGKAAALNRGICEARGEVILFTDARQLLEPDALRRLVANFADPAIGCVSGELILGEPREATTATGLGLYWRLEKAIRKWEARAGSSVGVTGAIYAARKSLLAPLPVGVILDDVYLPLEIARRGGRVIFEPRARAFDQVATGQKEFQRKVRTLIGNYQLLQLAPWLLTRANPVRFEFVCHKLLRLLVPFALAVLLVSSLFLHRAPYQIALALQAAFYAMAVLGVSRPRAGIFSRLTGAAFTFLMLNLAAAVAFLYFVRGKKDVWVSSRV